MVIIDPCSPIDFTLSFTVFTALSLLKPMSNELMMLSSHSILKQSPLTVLATATAGLHSLGFDVKTGTSKAGNLQSRHLRESSLKARKSWTAREALVAYWRDVRHGGWPSVCEPRWVDIRNVS